VQPVRKASGRVWRRASPILPCNLADSAGSGSKRRDRSPWRVGSTVHVGFARWWSQRIETLDLLTTSTVRNQRSATRALQGFHARTGLVNARLPKRTSSPSPPITPSRDLPSQNAEATAREPVVASTRSPTVRLQLPQPKWWSRTGSNRRPLDCQADWGPSLSGVNRREPRVSGPVARPARFSPFEPARNDRGTHT